MAPEDTLYGFGLYPPHPGYHHTGHFSITKFGDGLRATLEIPSPNVSGGPSQEFLGGRILGKTDGGNWVEAGWVEHSLLTVDRGYANPCAYSYDHPENEWHTYCAELPLTVGQVYVFKVEHVGCFGCSINRVQGLVLWNGTWYVIEQNANQKCRTSDDLSNCFWEVLLEPFTASGTHAGIGGDAYDGSGVNFQAIQFRRLSDGTWNLWEKSGHAADWGEVDPYEYCRFSGLQWHQFTAKRDVTCADP
jgi:hypothetical protein